MRPELLAPAGGPEALRAAVQCGADAVYLGFGAFNARRNAKNFTEAEFRAAVRYCHGRGVKVYLTLNTLLFDRELSAAAQTAVLASAIGVDAILVQDLGVLQAVRAAAPDLPLHASTQMTVHNTDGALQAREMGLQRVVLAREMAKEQIAAVCALEGIETEVFVHGAHCMCYSGQCAMSALIGGRSGNRGTCAQPCRLPYTLEGQDNRYPLSLKDMSLADHIPELTAMGISCLKLEGRMKRPEYVAVVTTIYAALLRENRRPTAAERRDLEAAFSRSGFTDGYFKGKPDASMFGVRGEKTPEPKELFAHVRTEYERCEHRSIPVSMALCVRRGVPCRLTVRDGAGRSAESTGPVPEEARSKPLTPEDLRARLGKTGGTAFEAAEIAVELDGGLSMPASAVNALRRDALAALEEVRCAPPPRRTGAYALPRKEHAGEASPRLSVSVARAGQVSAELLALSPALLYVPAEEIPALPPLAIPAGTLWAVLPRIYTDADRPRLLRLLQAAAERGAAGAAVSNLGHLPLCREAGLPMRGDWGLNVTNSETLRFLQRAGLRSAAVSFELRAEQIRDLDKALPTEAVVYGRLPLMLTEHCLNKPRRGACRCAEAPALLTDRTGAAFPVLPAFGCRSEIENCKTLFLADTNDWKRLGLAFARLRFTTEPAEECLRVLRRYSGAEEGWKPKEFTRGLFYRSVE